MAALRRIGIFALVCILSGCLGGGSSDPSSYVVQGLIRSGDGQPLKHVGVLVDAEHVVYTDAEGQYSVSGLQGTVTITPMLEGWSIYPKSQQVARTTSGLDFVGSEQAIGEIGRDGGVLLSIDGHASVQVDRDTFIADVELTLTRAFIEHDDVVGALYELGPAGMSFDAPVTLTISLEAAALSAAASYEYVIGRLDLEDGEFEVLETVVDLEQWRTEITQGGTFGLIPDPAVQYLFPFQVGGSAQYELSIDFGDYRYLSSSYRWTVADIVERHVILEEVSELLNRPEVETESDLWESIEGEALVHYSRWDAIDRYHMGNSDAADGFFSDAEEGSALLWVRRAFRPAIRWPSAIKPWQWKGRSHWNCQLGLSRFKHGNYRLRMIRCMLGTTMIQIWACCFRCSLKIRSPMVRALA